MAVNAQSNRFQESDYKRPPAVERSQCSLDEWKAYKMSVIDEKSSYLINEKGFEYNGKIFSLRKTAQLNILGVERKKNVNGVLPVLFNTIDNLDSEALTNVNQVDAFFMAALVRKKQVLDLGTQLKDQIRICVNKDAVDAILDERE